jgi:small subunit ribosomal protein S7
MHDGKKSTAQRVVYTAFDTIRDRMKDKDPVEVFTQAINNVRPLIQVRSKRVGGATYQVPMEVSRRRAQMLAIRWVLQAARGKKGRPVARALADELIAAYNGEGGAMTTRENVHKMAEANKAFAHFAW